MIRPTTTGTPVGMRRPSADSARGTLAELSATVARSSGRASRESTDSRAIRPNRTREHVGVSNYKASDFVRLSRLIIINTIAARLHNTPGVAMLRVRGGNMRISDIEQAVRAGLADEELKARIVNEGPVALSDIFMEIEAREAARTLTGRAVEMDSELKVQRATNGWI
jgi:hypothetical protein